MITKIGDNSLFSDEIRFFRRELQYEAKCGELDGGIHQFLQERAGLLIHHLNPAFKEPIHKTGDKSYCDHNQGTTSVYPVEELLH